MDPAEIATPHGPARAHVSVPGRPRGALLLGHGAGGGTAAPDLATAAAVALEESFAVALVEQPYRVAGRRAPPRAPALDAAWVAVAEFLRAGPLAGLPIVAGGRSSGGRVACRTAAAVGAVAVLCLAFPLRPPARPGAQPRPGRLPELEAVTVPVLVVQGERDPFGTPPEAPGRRIAAAPGDHSLGADRRAVGDAVRAWLRALPLPGSP